MGIFGYTGPDDRDAVRPELQEIATENAEADADMAEEWKAAGLPDD